MVLQLTANRGQGVRLQQPPPQRSLCQDLVLFSFRRVYSTTMKTLDQMTREERVQAAVHEYETSLKPILASIATKWGTDRFTLKRRLRGVGPRESRIGPGRKLINTQEAAIISYCARLDRINTSARVAQIEGAANLLLARMHEDPTTTPAVVGKHWTRRFLTRHPELHKVKQKPLDLLRHTIHDPQALLRFFEQLHK